MTRTGAKRRNGKGPAAPKGAALARLPPGAQVLVRGGPAGAKSLRQMQHASAVQWTFWPYSDSLNPREFDYGLAVGDGLDSSLVSPVLCFFMRTFPEARTVVQQLEDEQWRTIRRSHGNTRVRPLRELLARPNPFYGGRNLWMATCLDYCFGEAFWLKIRNVIGDVIELWWVPRGLMTPWAAPGGRDFITHYLYHTGGGPPLVIAPRDVVHFRFGQDPRNLRRGFSQLAAVMREVYTDEQACAFTASILRNLGIIGVVISPEVQEGSPASAQEDVKEVRDYIDANFTGERRGKTLAVGSPTKAQLLQYNLQGFDVGPIRDIGEERICAAIGLPAAVVGFGTGLQQTKVGATMKELIQHTWKGCLIPLQKILAEELDRALLPDFGLDPEAYRLAFDTTEVMALWEDEKDRGERLVKLFVGGVVKRGEARRELGLKTDEKDDIFMPTPSAGAPAPPPPASGNGGTGADAGGEP